MTVRASLNSPPSLTITHLPTKREAPYGVRGVDYVLDKPQCSVLALEIALEGDVSRAMIECITRAALDAANR